MPMLARTLVAAALVAAGPLATAGRVDVALVNPSNYTDAGNAVWEERPNAEALGRQLQALGARLLPADHVLAVELLDVDLAGTLSNRGSGLRTVRGNTDYPRIKLRYTLTAPGRAAVTREEEVRDIQFTRGVSLERNQPLYYEKRMLDRWFAERFAAPL